VYLAIKRPMVLWFLRKLEKSRSFIFFTNIIQKGLESGMIDLEETQETYEHLNYKNRHFDKWISYIFGLIAQSFNFFHRVNMTVLTPNILDTFKVSSTKLGLLSSIYFYSYAASQPLVGIFTNHYKPRRVMTISFFIMTIGTFLFVHSPNYLVMFMGRILIGTGSAGILIPVLSMVNNSFSYRNRGLLFALVMFSGNVGSILGGYPFAKLTDFMGWRNALTSVAFFSLIFLVLIWLVVREDHSVDISLEYLSKQEKQNIMPISEQKVNWIGVCRKIMETPVIKYTILISMINIGALSSFRSLWAVPFLMDVYKIEKTTASGLITMSSIGLLVGILIFGRFLDKKYGNILYLLGSLSSLILYLTFFIYMEMFTNYHFFNLLFFIWGFCQGSNSFALKIHSIAIPRQYYVTALGIINIFPLLGSALCQSITGILFDLFRGETITYRPVGSYKIYFLFLALCMIIAVLFNLKTINILKRDYKDEI